MECRWRGQAEDQSGRESGWTQTAATIASFALQHLGDPQQVQRSLLLMTRQRPVIDRILTSVKGQEASVFGGSQSVGREEELQRRLGAESGVGWVSSIVERGVSLDCLRKWSQFYSQENLASTACIWPPPLSGDVTLTKSFDITESHLSYL